MKQMTIYFINLNPGQQSSSPVNILYICTVLYFMYFMKKDTHTLKNTYWRFLCLLIFSNEQNFCLK